MKKFLAALLTVLLASCTNVAYAADTMVATDPANPADKVRLFAQPCGNDAVLMPAELRPRFQMGEGTIGARSTGCAGRCCPTAWWP